ncbi:MAG: indole-3-glycerol phosphate synthase TrpC [Anaerolineales bacterium]|nr:indole-3-glycerol phosphate synthase TrpC [Anaerolineales bacterium]
MADRLRQILAHKRAEIERLDLREQMARAKDAPPVRDFLAALTSPLTPALFPSPGPKVQERGEGWRAAPGRGVRAVHLIAELKRASPSRGLLAPHLNLGELAHVYVENGAAALSVLTDEAFFLGHLNDLRELRFTHLVKRPLLRKDFMLAPVQLYESRAAGADAILLIVAALDDATLCDLHALALDLGLTALVEVHTAEEVERALRIPNLRLIGINNRDLATFNVSLDTTVRLRPLIPPGITVVSESGLFTAVDVRRMAECGVDAVLIGEALVTAGDIGAKVRELANC